MGVTFPLLVAALAYIFDLGFYIGIFLAAIAALPLFASGSRRLNDTGIEGVDAVKPWGYFAVGAILAYWGASAILQFSSAFATNDPPDGPGGFLFVLIYGYGGGLCLLASLVTIIAFLSLITPAFGQTILPSQPGPNKYGPNPNEVTQ